MSVTQASLLGDTFGSKASGTIPVGGIIMWTGTTIPTGWALCNGANGTPNLTNRFIVGASNTSKTGTTSQLGSSPYNPGDAGGSADATLVSHSHTAISSVTDSGHKHQSTPNSAGTEGPAGGGFLLGYGHGGFVDTTTVTTGITVSTTINPAGSSATNANLPPYYALAFIMRVS